VLFTTWPWVSKEEWIATILPWQGKLREKSNALAPFSGEREPHKAIKPYYQGRACPVNGLIVERILHVRTPNLLNGCANAVPHILENTPQLLDVNAIFKFFDCQPQVLVVFWFPEGHGYAYGDFRFAKLGRKSWKICWNISGTFKGNVFYLIGGKIA